MANLNKVMLIGRLTVDPKPIEVRGSVAGAKFGFAVNNRKLNQSSQQWENVPVFIDMEIWNRGETSRQADRVLQTLKKGSQVYIEGHLRMDQWDDANGGGKRSKLVVVVENFQYLDARQDGMSSEGEGAPVARQPARAAAPASRGYQGGSPRGGNNAGYAGEDDSEGPSTGGYSGKGAAPSDDDIPF